MTPLEAFRLVAPEFAAEADSVVNDYLDLALLWLNVGAYPADTQPVAQALKAASLMVQRKKSQNGESSGGGLLEEKEGDLMRKYADDDGIDSDIYAQQLQQLTLGVFGLGIITR